MVEFDIEIDVSEYRSANDAGALSDLGCDLVEDTVMALDVGQTARIVCGRKLTAHIDVHRTEQHTIVTRGGYTADPKHYASQRHAARRAWMFAELKLEQG